MGRSTVWTNCCMLFARSVVMLEEVEALLEKTTQTSEASGAAEGRGKDGLTGLDLSARQQGAAYKVC